MSATPHLYDRARAAIGVRGLDAEIQTKIALFLGAAKTVNATIMAAFELQPQVSAAYPFLHGQYFRELEFASLLSRVTRWSPNPALYFKGAELASPLWIEWWQLLIETASPRGPRVACGGLALGHALLAKVRLTPLLPPDTNELDAFVVAIRRIEQESVRMIQAQIRLLKEAASALGEGECERIIEAKRASVEVAFERFLEWLAGDPAQTAIRRPPAGSVENAARRREAGSIGNTAPLSFLEAATDVMRTLGTFPARNAFATTGKSA